MTSIPARFRSPWRRSIVGAIGLVLAAMATGCGSDGLEPSSDGRTRLRVTVTPGAGSVPFRIAVTEGIFKKNGLDVKVTEGIDFSSYIAALDRQFDAAMVTPEVTLLAVAAGRELKAYAGMQAISSDKESLPIITNDREINSLEDLADKGGSLGAVTSPERMSAQLKLLLEGTGANSEDIKIVPVPFQDMADQLRAGRIDAAQPAVGFYEQLLKEGFRIIASLPQAYLTALGGELPVVQPHFVSTPGFLDRNPEVVQAFTDSIHEAIDLLEANPEKGLEAYAEWTGRDPKTVVDIELPDWKPDFTAADFDAWQEFLVYADLIEDPVDTEALIVEGLEE